MTKLASILLTLERAEADLLLELQSLYRTGTKVRAKMQTNHPADTLTVVRVMAERPGFLRVKYDTGYESSLHCREILL